MQTKTEPTIERIFHEAKRAVATCPYCQRPIRPSQRLSYPPAAVGAFATVYRCSCGRHIGAPIGREE